MPGVRAAYAVLEQVGGVPKGMTATGVLADMKRQVRGVTTRRLTFFFTHRGKRARTHS